MARWLLLPALLWLAACTSVPPPSLPPAADRAGSVTAAGEPPQVLALLGATGMVGGYLLDEALARGYAVRALSRSPEKLDAYRDRITIVQGDARDRGTIRELLRGSTAVVSALGPVRADGDAARFVNTAVTRNVLDEMAEGTADFYIAVSGAAVVMPGDERNLLGWWIRKLAQLGLRSTLQDKQAEYALLASSEANWTLVRCPLIDPEPYRSVPQLSVQTPPAFRVRAGELAHFMLDQVASREYAGRGPFLGSH